MIYWLAGVGRYFQYCAPPESIAGEPIRMPLRDAPFEETKETLATRAEYSARSFVALNLQFDRILGSLPADEGDDEEQYKILEQLAGENETAGLCLAASSHFVALPFVKKLCLAGEELERDAAEAELMLQQVREAMKAICDARCTDALEQLSTKMSLLSKGLDAERRASHSGQGGCRQQHRDLVDLHQARSSQPSKDRG